MSRTPSRRLLAVLGVALVTLLVVGGVLALTLPGGDEPPSDDSAPTPTAAPTVAPTPLDDYDTTTVAVRRQPFCPAVPTEAVERALGGAVAATAHYRDGQRARLDGEGRDIAHENGCDWSGAADGVTARAWVFAPPVTPGQARGLVRAAVREDGCERLQRPAPDFGAVSAGVLCRDGRGPDATVEASFRGLFGDAWLSCSITGPATGTAEGPSSGPAEGPSSEPTTGPPPTGSTEDPAPVDRVGEWCVAVAQAASGTVPEPTSD